MPRALPRSFSFQEILRNSKLVTAYSVSAPMALLFALLRVVIPWALWSTFVTRFWVFGRLRTGVAYDCGEAAVLDMNQR